MAGANEIDEGKTQWVCSMGHLMGLFDKEWLGIPSTGKMAFLRYAEFIKIEEGKIVENALFCDIISIMQQAGLRPLPEQTGAMLITPGPKTHDGLMFDAQDSNESQKTLNLINSMIQDLNDGHNKVYTPQEEMARAWHKDMIWFGPAGIGATYTIDRYIQQHQQPFRQGLEDRIFNGHICRFAEGSYGGFFGWANLSMKIKGGFMGMPVSNQMSEMRVVDIYRREGDKIAENWVFIDLLHFYHKLGLDILGRMQSLTAILKYFIAKYGREIFV